MYYRIEWYVDGRWHALAGAYATHDQAWEKVAEYRKHHTVEKPGLYRVVEAVGRLYPRR